MTTPKVDFRALIRDGHISSDRAGQLIALDNYEGGGILTNSEESALRRSTKDTSTLNSYIGGSNRLLRMEGNYLAVVTEIDRDINYIMWGLSAVKHTAVVKYTEPTVVVVTEEKYKKIPQEKHDLRLKRTYKLIVLYRAIVEDMVFNRRSQNLELVKQLEQTAKEGKEGKFGNKGYLYGIDLIAQADDIFLGWVPYNTHCDFTLADFANDLPEVHTLAISELSRLYKENKLSVDPDNIPLEKYKDTNISGTELEKLDIGRLKEWFWAVEGSNSPLDDYLPDEAALSGLTRHKSVLGEDVVTSDRQDVSIATKYQKYAILQNAKPRDIHNGQYKMDSLWEMEWGPFFGYKDDYGDDANAVAEAFIKKLQKARNAIILNARLLLVFMAFRQKAGQLLHITKSDGFADRTQTMFNLDNRLEQYELWRNIYQLEDIRFEISDPKAIDYLKRVEKATAPLYDKDNLPLVDAYMARGTKHETKLQIRRPTNESMRQWLENDDYVTKSYQVIEAMELTFIEKTSDRLLELLREIVRDEP